MARGLSIRFRLTAWYFLSLVTVLGLLAAASWLAVRASMYRAVDQGLLYDIRGVREFLDSRGDPDPERLREELGRRSNLLLGGGLFQVFDADGRLVYQSPGLTRHGIPASPPPVAGDAVTYRDAGPEGWPVRLAAQRLEIGGEPHVIEVADPLRSLRAALSDYSRVLLLVTPLMVLAASGVGYWISGRALAPVDRIIEDARAIGSGNLSERLTVPPARDELRHLSETLNAMLGRIEDAVTRIGQFTADASHELRAPLALVQAAAEHSLRRERSREELTDALHRVLRESERMARLLDDLLLLARADASHDAFEPAPVDLAALLRDVAERAQGLADAKGLAFASEPGEHPVRVVADAALLQRLVMILIDNAVKYTPEGGEVRLALRSDGERARVEVADTGVGIAPDDMPYVFDRFWRADRVRSRGIGGSGLGLSIARWIAERSGGELTVESAVDRGSTFRLVLPEGPARGA